LSVVPLRATVGVTVVPARRIRLLLEVQHAARQLGQRRRARLRVEGRRARAARETGCRKKPTPLRATLAAP